MRQRLTATVLMCLLLAASAPLTQATEGRSSGVDLSVGDLAFSYSTSADEGSIGCFPPTIQFLGSIDLQACT